MQGVHRAEEIEKKKGEGGFLRGLTISVLLNAPWLPFRLVYSSIQLDWILSFSSVMGHPSECRNFLVSLAHKQLLSRDYSELNYTLCIENVIVIPFRTIVAHTTIYSPLLFLGHLLIKYLVCNHVQMYVSRE